MQSNQCLECAHYLGLHRCNAFPDKDIPEEIFTGEFDHREKHPDQENEVVFEQVKIE